MPVCYLKTNMKSFTKCKNAEEEMAKLIATMFDVPIKIVFVTTQFGMPAYMAGSSEPGLVCQISALNVLEDSKKAETYFTKIYKKLVEITGLKEDRILVHLEHIPTGFAMIGK